jgi:exopolysaccharide transport family protein
MEEERIDIRDYLDVILKWRWVIITIFLVVVVTVTIHAFVTRPEYKATVRISIEKENPNVVSIEEVLQMDTSQADYLQTQVDILKSNSLANEVISRLNLEESPEFKPSEEDLETSWVQSLKDWVQDLKDWVKSFFVKSDESDMVERDQIYSPLVGAYLNRLTIEPVRRTRLIDISYEGYYPEIVTKITNEHMQAYIDKNLELKFQAAQDALSWLNKKLIDVRTKLRESEDTLQKFKEKEDIVSLGDIMSLGSKGDSIIQQKLSELSSALTAARIERINLETTQKRLKQIENRSELIESFPKIIDNDLVNDLKSSLATLLRKKSELGEKYGEKHPKMTALNAEIKQQEEKILEEIAKIAKSIKTQYEIAREREISLQNEMEREKKKAQDLTKKSLQFAVLQREVESNKQLYTTLLTRMKETSLTSGLRTSNIKIIDRADVPVFPVKPKKKRNILLAVIVGLGMGVGMAFFLEYLNDSIESPDDLEKHIDIPFLGSMGYVKLAKDKESDVKQKELFSIHDPKSSTAEALRSIRVNIAFRLQGEGAKSFVVTSATPGEGKTLFALNMGVMFAGMGKKTVVVDGDLRRPRVHEIMEFDKKPGLSDALIGDVPFSKIIRKGPVPNMFIVTSGTIPPNPTELLTTGDMSEFSKSLHDLVDVIIYDSPPVTSVADSLILAQAAKNVVLMIKMGETSKKMTRSVVKQLKELDIKVVGAVLNEVDFKKELYYGKYGKYGKYYRYYKRYYKYDYYHKEPEAGRKA